MHAHWLKVLLALSISLGCVGCTTSLTNMTPTRALEPGHVQVSAQAQGQLNTGVISKSIAAGKGAKEAIEADSDEPIDEETFRDFIDGGLAWFLFPPGVGFEFMARIGLVEWLEGIDFGLRYDTKLLKGDLKFQFFESEDGRYALSGLVGYGHHLGVVNSVLSYLALTDWSRQDLDFQLSGGIELGDIFKGYLNPRVVVSHISVEHKLPEFIRERIPPSFEQYDPNQLFEDEWMVYYGLTWGMMIGYKHAFLAIELNMFRLAFEPTILGEKRSFNSAVFAPTGGLVVLW